MEQSTDTLFGKIIAEAEKSRFEVRESEEGTVLSVGDGIMQVGGLSNARLYELVELESGDEGIVFDIDAASIGVVLLTEKKCPGGGDRVYQNRTDRIGQGRGIPARQGGGPAGEPP